MTLITKCYRQGKELSLFRGKNLSIEVYLLPKLII